jgi:RNA polymerase sigma factor for flagellar operon FliA
MGLTLHELADLRAAANQCVSKRSTMPIAKRWPLPTTARTLRLAGRRGNSPCRRRAIAALPERLQMVIQLYFVEELNLAEIAASARSQRAARPPVEGSGARQAARRASTL